jgi:peptidoglycan/xylan/chitin deacetylase (PgdA/CDA1 family)
VERCPAAARRIVDAGHEIGNHSYSHPIYLYCTPRETRRQVARAQDAIADVTGVRPRIARPPCGVRTPAYFRVADELGLRTVLWSATGYDWKPRTAPAIARSVLAEVGAGSIVLLHDGATGAGARRLETVRSLPTILSGARARALRCVRVSELLRITVPETAHVHA